MAPRTPLWDNRDNAARPRRTLLVTAPAWGDRPGDGKSPITLTREAAMGSGLIDPRWDRSSPNPHAKPSARLVGGIIKEREREFPLLPIPKPTSFPRRLFRR